MRQREELKDQKSRTNSNYIPTLYPYKNLPIKIISNDLAILLRTIKTAATMATTLFIRRAFFLQNECTQTITHMQDNMQICCEVRIHTTIDFTLHSIQ